MDQNTHRLTMSAYTGNSVPRTIRLTSGTSSYTIPATVSNLKTAVGQGGDGYPPEDYYVERYRQESFNNQRLRSTGEVVVVAHEPVTGYGPTPENYCGPVSPTPSNPTYSETWTCHYFDDTSYWDSTNGSNGIAATGFGRTFPGGAQAQAPITSFTNVPVTPGQTYPISIPSGGYITITFDEIVF